MHHFSGSSVRNPQDVSLLVREATPKKRKHFEITVKTQTVLRTLGHIAVPICQESRSEFSVCCHLDLLSRLGIYRDELFHVDSMASENS